MNLWLMWLWFRVYINKILQDATENENSIIIMSDEAHFLFEWGGQ